MIATFDTLAYAKRLKEAGFSDSQAEAQTLALADALKQGVGQLATKGDLLELRQVLAQDISDLRQEMGGLRQELKQDISDLRQELKQDVNALRQEMGDLRHEVRELEERTRGRFTLLQWMLGFDLALTVAVFWFLLRQAGAF